jgi:dTDP-4-amino-4,6-dideoxygalactose transaminase
VSGNGFTPVHSSEPCHEFQYVLPAGQETSWGEQRLSSIYQPGFLAVLHCVSLHSSPFSQSVGVPKLDLPVTDDTSNRLLRLPMYYDLSDQEAAEVAEVVLGF